MPPLHLKQEFASLKNFKEALYIWAIEAHFEPRILKSDSHHVRVGCKFDPKCEFSIRCNAYNASPRIPIPFAKITVLRHDHTCTPQDPTNPLNRQVANRIPWLVENVPRFLDVTPTTTIESIQEAILEHSGYTVNLQQIRRVRRLLVKGKDFRSPMREHGGAGGNNGGAMQQQQQQQQHGSHGQQQQHSHEKYGHGQHPPSFREPHNETSPSHSHSHILQDQGGGNEDFNATSARLANQFEDHSQLIGALTDGGGLSNGGGLPNGGLSNGQGGSQVQTQIQSANMFDVNNPPPPRIIEAPVTSGLVRHTAQEAAVRCPFCVNVRWMKSIKDAVDHMTMHVV